MNRRYAAAVGGALALALASSASAYDTLVPLQAYNAVVNQGAVILDVRTEEEFIWVGHPYLLDAAGAESKVVNVPLKRLKQVKGVFAWVSDPLFLDKVGKELGSSQDIHIITMCRSGGRGAAAATALEAAGYTHVSNMTQGFEGGLLDSYGRRTVNGWKNTYPYPSEPTRPLPSHTSI